ncbi:hypothetical protein EJB05_36016, partial [Eragrostis curvula]
MRSRWPIPKDWKTPTLATTDWLLVMLLECLPEARDMLLLILWRAWFVRNQITHDGPEMSVEGSVQFLLSYYDTLFNVRQDQIPSDVKRKEPGNVRTIKKWVKPPCGRAKINVDAAFSVDSGRAGVGVIIRNDHGEIVLCSGRVVFNCASAEEAELLACKEGLNLGLKWVAMPCELESDCLVVCNALKSNEENGSHYALLLREVKELIAELREVRITHCNRTQNRVSHILAGRASREMFSKVWLHSFPDFVASSVATDCNPIMS